MYIYVAHININLNISSKAITRSFKTTKQTFFEHKNEVKVRTFKGKLFSQTLS